MAIVISIGDNNDPDRLTRFIYGLLWEYCTYGQMATVIDELEVDRRFDKHLLALAEQIAERINLDADCD